MESLTYVWIIGGVVAAMVLYQIAKRKVYKDEQLDQLKESRSVSDLEAFYTYYETKGVPRRIIDKSLKYVRDALFARNFIPKPGDSFKETYGLKSKLADQYDSWPMRIAGNVCRDLAVISITESDWARFQKEQGEIDNFDMLFDYLKTKLGKYWR